MADGLSVVIGRRRREQQHPEVPKEPTNVKEQP